MKLDIESSTSPDMNKHETFSDEKTDMKIHQHLSDINDVISAQDIENVRTDFTEKSDQVVEQNDLLEKPEKNDEHPAGEEKDSKDENEAIPITPWNILGS